MSSSFDQQQIDYEATLFSVSDALSSCLENATSEESAVQSDAPLTLFLSRITGGGKRFITGIVYDNARGAHPSLRISRRRRDHLAFHNTSDYDSDDDNEEYNHESRHVDSMLTPPQRRLSSLGSSCSSIAIPHANPPLVSDHSMDLSGSWTTDNRWGVDDDYDSARKLRQVSPPSPPLSPYEGDSRVLGQAYTILPVRKSYRSTCRIES